MTGSYNNFFKIFDRRSKRDVMYEATKEIASSLSGLKPRKVSHYFFIKGKICTYKRTFTLAGLQQLGDHRKEEEGRNERGQS